MSSTTAELSWGPPPPQERNGIIRQYLITVEPSGGEPSSFTTTATSSYTVSALRPFTVYSFSVAAVTIGPGPLTQQIQIETSTDGKYYTLIDLCLCHNIIIIAMNHQFLCSSWRSTRVSQCSTTGFNQPGSKLGATTTRTQEWSNSTIYDQDHRTRDWSSYYTLHRGDHRECDIPSPILHIQLQCCCRDNSSGTILLSCRNSTTREWYVVFIS